MRRVSNGGRSNSPFVPHSGFGAAETLQTNMFGAQALEQIKTSGEEN